MIYLYVKTHTKTGLKYFGYTKADNPYQYKGSGLYWRNHCRKHGNHISTKVIGKFSDKEKEAARSFALEFSIQHNIVKSNDWANLKLEVLDGGFDHINNEKVKHLFVEKTRVTLNNWSNDKRKQINSKKALPGALNGMYGVHRRGENAPGYGKPATEERKRNISKAKKAQQLKLSKERKQQISENSKSWWDRNPDVRKQRSEEYKRRGHKPPSPKDLKWWRNGDIVVRAKESPGNEWINSR